MQFVEGEPSQSPACVVQCRARVCAVRWRCRCKKCGEQFVANQPPPTPFELLAVIRPWAPQWRRSGRMGPGWRWLRLPRARGTSLQLTELCFAAHLKFVCSSLARIVHGQRLRAFQAISCVQYGGNGKHLQSCFVNACSSMHFTKSAVGLYFVCDCNVETEKRTLCGLLSL